jgi:hypothetical protein
MRTPWLTKVRREWAALTGGPVSFSWWMVRAFFRVVFGVALIGGLSLLHLNAELVQAVADGAASPLAIVAWAFTMPEYLGLLAIAATASFALPFLPDRDPYNNQY